MSIRLIASQGSCRSRVLGPCHLFLDTCNNPGRQTSSCPLYRWRVKALRSPESQRLSQTRTRSPRPFLSIPSRNPCVYTSMDIRVRVSTCAPELPCSCSWMLRVQTHRLGQACSRQFHPVGGGGEGRSGEGATPTFLCCPLISAAAAQAPDCCVLS